MVNDSLLIDDFDDEELDLINLFLDSNKKGLKINNTNDFSDEENYKYNEDSDDLVDELNDNFCDIITEGHIIPDIKIEVEKDENNEKIVKFTLNLIINEETNETINIDLNKTKKTYLMIAEELFK